MKRHRIFIGRPGWSIPNHRFHALFSDPGTETRTVPYPFLPAVTAARLTAAGHTVRVLDGLGAGVGAAVFLHDVRAFAPDLILLELLSSNREDVVKIAAELTRDPSPPGVLIADPEHVLSASDDPSAADLADAVFPGVYDAAVAEYLGISPDPEPPRPLRSSLIQSAYFCRAEGLPQPAIPMLMAPVSLNPGRWLSLPDGPVRWGRSEESIAGEAEWLQTTLAAGSVVFMDPDFWRRPKQAESVLAAMDNLALPVVWGASVRAGSVNTGRVNAMVQRGLARLEILWEWGDPAATGPVIQGLKETVAAASAAGPRVIIRVIVPNPSGEIIRTIRTTLKTIQPHAAVLCTLESDGLPGMAVTAVESLDCQKPLSGSGIWFRPETRRAAGSLIWRVGLVYGTSRFIWKIYHSVMSIGSRNHADSDDSSP